MQPEDAVAAMGDESIDEEAGAAHEHVGDAFDAREGVVELIGGGEKLMLADVEAVSLGKMNGEEMAGAVAAERDAAWAVGFGHEDGHAGENALESAGESFYADGGARVFPEQDVVLEIDRSAG